MKMTRGVCRHCLAVIQPELEVYDEDRHLMQISCPECGDKTQYVSYAGVGEKARDYAWRQICRPLKEGEGQ